DQGEGGRHREGGLTQHGGTCGSGFHLIHGARVPGTSQPMLRSRLPLAAAEVARGRALEDPAAAIEAGAVQGTIPGLLGVVPAQDPAEVGADAYEVSVDAGRRG